MPFNIDRFIAQQNKLGVARPHSFEIYLAAPSLKDNITAKAFSRIYAKAGSIPGVSTNYVEIPYQGMVMTLPSQRFYPEWTVTIINDRQFILRNILEKWMDEISNLEGLSQTAGISVGGLFQVGRNTKDRINLNRILKDIWVVQYSSEVVPVPVGVYFLRDAFPMDLSPLELGWDQTDSTQDYTVTFKYQYFEKKALNEIPGEIAAAIS